MRTRAPDLTSDTDLGGIQALARYMHVAESYLSAVKKGAIIRAAQASPERPNPACFTGSKSCKKWVMEWLERNRDFKTTEAKVKRPTAATAATVLQ